MFTNSHIAQADTRQTLPANSAKPTDRGSLMNEKKRIGLVGCGRWGQFILRDLVSLGCEVTVVARSAVTAQRALAGQAAAVVNSVAELPHVDGAVVATPTSTHAAVIEELLERGVPIFTEKPLCADATSAARLARLAPDYLFVMDKWRYHPGVEMLAAIARSEELGPVLGLRTTRAQWGSPHLDVDGIWILAPHDLSIALEVLGQLPAPRGATIERVGGLATGLVGLLGSEPWFVCEVSTRYPAYRREIRLHCRAGVAILDDGYSAHLQIARYSGPHETKAEIERRPISTELPLLRELRAFVEHLNGGPPPRSSAAEGAALVATIATLRALAGLDQPEQAA